MTQVVEDAQHPVALFLAKHNIKEVLLIDDAFDVPTAESHHDFLGTFWAALERDPALGARLSEIAGQKVESPEQIVDGVLARLYSYAPADEPLAAICRDKLFSKQFEKLKSLAPLQKHLKDLRLDVTEIGAEAELPKRPIRLVFLDYYLGPDDGEEAMKASAEKASVAYDQLADEHDKPFIVLMSSSPTVKARAEEFRQKSRLLGGLFAFMEKRQLAKQEDFFLYLQLWALGVPTRHRIQQFVDAVESGARAATDAFIEGVRALGIHDYANIQALSLQIEGHPLGDYMLWLYKSYFMHIFHGRAEVQTQQRELDKLKFDGFTPCEEPSAQLARIYRAALTEPGVEEVGAHPWAGAGSQEPLLTCGDMFFGPVQEHVQLVISAPCDLAYSPGSGNREFPGDRPVLFIRGTLQPHEVIDQSDHARTELFEHDGKPYRILWDQRHVTSKPYGEVWPWLRENALVRKARLALPYVLEVQQTFALNLMRPGMPVRPPTFRHADVEVYCPDDNDDFVRLGEPIHAGACIMRRRKKDRDEDEDAFVLTAECIAAIISRLDPVAARANARHKEATDQLTDFDARAGGKKDDKGRAKVAGKVSGAQTLQGKVEQLQRSCVEWISAAREPRSLPAGEGRTEVDSKHLWVYHERVFSGNYAEKPPIVLNLRNVRHEAGSVAAPQAPVAPPALPLGGLA